MLSPPRPGFSDRENLVDALLDCGCMKHPQSRVKVTQNLPLEIQQIISAGGNNKQDVDDIVRSCMQFPDGLKRLLDVVKYYEGNSLLWQRVQEAWREISSKTSVPTVTSPQTSASTPPSPKRRKSRSKYDYDVFLSHNSSDKPLVEILAARIEDEGKLRPFLDKWHLVPGEPWQEGLEDALDKSATYAVFLGPAGLGPWENEEMRDALDRRVRDKSRRVIPVLLPGANPKDDRTLPRFLQILTWVDFRNGINDHDAFRRLVAGVKGKSPGR
jgi:hypothetical protein